MNNLTDLRQQINEIDQGILIGLKKRFEVVREIGLLKKELGQEIFVEDREDELFGLYEKLAKELNLDLDFVRKLFSIIICESKQRQETSL